VNRTRVWIDTDIGDDPDDAIALTLAVRHPNAELVGVSTVDGDVEHRALLARRLLVELGSNVPVHAGAIPTPTPDVDVLVAIGPLTNVARLHNRTHEPQPRVVAMGGALAPVRHRGRTCEREHNFATDGIAAAHVVRTATQLVLVPLDVTARLCIDDEQAAALAATAPTVAAEIDAWRATTSAPVCLHDPLAVLVALGDDDAAVQRRVIRLAVDADGRVHAGEGDEGETVHDVVTDVDATRAIARIIDVCTDRG
jgi:inosine-uridine nucleoside N-ribohydrolase